MRVPWYVVIAFFLGFVTSIPKYTIVFLRGSFVSKSFYMPFLHTLQRKLRDTTIETTVEFGEYCPLRQYQNNTILLSHSFGGTFALLHCVADTDNCIRGCILINSHFNQEKKMPYPGFLLRTIKQSVFTILNEYDEKLPIAKSIDDLYVKVREKLSNKFFVINKGTHFSTFQNYDEVDHTTDQVVSYIESIYKQNFAPMQNITYTTIVEYNVTDVSNDDVQS